MKTVDRINAVLRTKEYETAFNCCEPWIKDGLVAMRDSDSQALCNRFKIPFPYAPYSTIESFPPVLPISQPGRKEEATILGPDESLWITVRIDMTQKIGPIQDEIKRIHDTFRVRKHPDFEKTRDTPSSLNIWKIYDKVTLKKMTMYAVAQELGMKSKPTDDKQSKSVSDQVTEAFYKAQQMIKDVESGAL